MLAQQLDGTDFIRKLYALDLAQTLLNIASM